MRTRKRRKRSPGLLHYSSGRWREEANQGQFLQGRRQPELTENEYQTEKSKEINISTL